VWGYIESGKQEGAKIILGGEKRNSKGYYVDPTSESPYSKFSSRVLFLIASVFTNIRPDMKIVNTSIWLNFIESG
jgi:aldehyde dehydrogenase (NAD+)